MLKTSEKRYTVRLVYICFLLVYMLVREVLPWQFLIGSTYLSAAVFSGGFALVLWDLLTERQCLRSRAVDLLLLFAGVCCVSSLLNYRYGIGGNIKAVGALVLEYALLYACGVDADETRKRRELSVLCITFSVVWGILCFLSVHMYVFDVEYTVSGATQGFTREYMRLWGVFQDPNYAGCLSLVALLAAGYLMAVYRRRWIYLVCGLQMLLQLTFILLGGSRASVVILLCLSLLTAVYLFVLHAKRLQNRLKGALLSLGCTATVALLFFLLQYAVPLYKTAVRAIVSDQTVVQTVYDGLYAAVDAERVEYILTDEGEGGIDFIHRTDTDKADVSNGRFTRWKDTVTVFSKTPIIGTSPRNVSAFAKQHAPQTLMAKYDIAPHNGYLDVLVGSGVIGFAVMLTFLSIALLAVVSGLFKRSPTPETVLTAGGAFVFAAAAVFISDVFLLFTAGAVFFWLCLGYAVHIVVPSRDSYSIRCLRKIKR